MKAAYPRFSYCCSFFDGLLIHSNLLGLGFLFMDWIYTHIQIHHHKIFNWKFECAQTWQSSPLNCFYQFSNEIKTPSNHKLQRNLSLNTLFHGKRNVNASASFPKITDAAAESREGETSTLKTWFTVTRAKLFCKIPVRFVCVQHIIQKSCVYICLCTRAPSQTTPFHNSSQHLCRLRLCVTSLGRHFA